MILAVAMPLFCVFALVAPAVAPSHPLDRSSVTGPASGAKTAAGGRPAPGTPQPDGVLVFESDRDGNGEIYAKRADGGPVRRLTRTPADERNPVWSHDGQRIAFVSARDGNDELYVMNADGTGVARLTRNPGTDDNPGWSIDDRRIAYSSERGDREIVVMNADGSNAHAITSNGELDAQPDWSLDPVHARLRDRGDERRRHGRRSAHCQSGRR
jgi:dipeptidyl aminopeptidase/acylaminoacyl peptidase